jgi:hypothetical protein
MKTFLYLLIAGLACLLPWFGLDLFFVSRADLQAPDWMFIPCLALFPIAFYWVICVRLRQYDRVAQQFYSVVGAVVACIAWAPVAFYLVIMFHFAIGGRK